jgi:hypothetical protein
VQGEVDSKEIANSELGHMRYKPQLRSKKTLPLFSEKLVHFVQVRNTAPFQGEPRVNFTTTCNCHRAAICQGPGDQVSRAGAVVLGTPLVPFTGFM